MALAATNPITAQPYSKGYNPGTDSGATTRLSLRQLAEDAYKGFERERIESWRRKSARLLEDRLATLFCLGCLQIPVKYREDGTAYTVVEGIEFEAPQGPAVAGLYIVDGDRRHHVGGLVDLGRYLTETEADR